MGETCKLARFCMIGFATTHAKADFPVGNWIVSRIVKEAGWRGEGGGPAALPLLANYNLVPQPPVLSSAYQPLCYRNALLHDQGFDTCPGFVTRPTTPGAKTGLLCTWQLDRTSAFILLMSFSALICRFLAFSLTTSMSLGVISSYSGPPCETTYDSALWKP